MAKSYRQFLNAWISDQQNNGRGIKSRMSEVIGTKTGFITQVFQELADFSLEQALGLASWMGLNEKEKEYFLVLVQRDRAGTKDLKDYFNAQLNKLSDAQNNLSQRLEIKRVPSEVNQSIYFSSWTYSCAHVLLTCRGPHTAQSMALRLGISLSTCREILDFLVQSDLAKEKNGQYETGEARMHLGTDSPNLLKHHLNWNLRGMQAIEADLKKGVHYSSVVSVSKEDYARVREGLVQAIEKAKSIIKESPGEVVCGFTLNLFEVAPELR